MVASFVGAAATKGRDTRSLHPGPMAERFASLSEVEALFERNPNVMGVHSGESMSGLYKGGQEMTYSHRLIRLCAKYGKLFYMADGTYPLDNKWETMYSRSGDFLREHKDYLIFAQKNNILQRQMLSQSSAMGLYLSGAITNHGAWEDGGWYWQQVGFQTLGELFGRRGGDVRTMPRIFWCLNFVMGISRGTAVFSLDGQTGTAPASDASIRTIDAPLAANPAAYWTRDGKLLPAYRRFVEPLFNAILKHQLIPTKEQVLDNIRMAVYKVRNIFDAAYPAWYEGDDPEGFGQTANRYASWVQQYFDCLAEANVPIVMIHDDIVWTSGPFTAPDWYRQYIFPNYKRMFAPLLESGKKLTYCSDGNYSKFIDDIAACGVDGFVMEPMTDMQYIAEKYGKTHYFIGNADTRILLDGTKEEIRREVVRCMDIGKCCPGFFMAVGNHIPANTPVENAIYYNQCYLEMSSRK